MPEHCSARAGSAAQLAIALIVIAVVAMLIVPLPRAVLDILLTLNIAIAVALLMAAVFTPRPLSFASFPTLLVSLRFGVPLLQKIIPFASSKNLPAAPQQILP